MFTAATRHAVAEDLEKALRDQQRGININPGRQTVGEFLKSWLTDDVKPSVKPKTYRTYADFVKLHLGPALGSIQLAGLSPQHVRAFQNEKLTTPQPSRKKVNPGQPPEPGMPLSSRTVKHHLATLRTALESAVKDGLIPRNVAAQVDPPSVAKRQMKTLSPEEARAFLDAIASDPYEAVFSTTIAIAYRQGGALGLQWPDVDLENGILTIRQAIQLVDRKLTVVPTKKDKIHTVNLLA